MSLGDREKPASDSFVFTGGWDALHTLVSLPSTIRKLQFKHRDPLKLMQYSYLSGGSPFVQMEAGDIFNEENVKWRNPQIWVKGTATEIVEVEWWV